MSIMTRLFPHRALSEARGRIEDHEATILILRRRLCESERVIRARVADSAVKDSRIRLQKEEIMRLTKIVDNAHPRDPKTGRIMGKGSAQ